MLMHALTYRAAVLRESGLELPEHLEKKKELWEYIQEYYPWVYDRLRHRALGVCLNLPGKTGLRIAVGGYKISQKIFGFN